MRFIHFAFLAAALVATLPDDDLTISPYLSSDLFTLDMSNDPTSTLGGNDDVNLFSDTTNAADLFPPSNIITDNLDPDELQVASCTSGIEQPLSKRSGEEVCDLNSPLPIGNFLDGLRDFFGIQAKEGALTKTKEKKCLPPYVVHLCCTTEGPLLAGSELIHEYMWWCRVADDTIPLCQIYEVCCEYTTSPFTQLPGPWIGGGNCYHIDVLDDIPDH